MKDIKVIKRITFKEPIELVGDYITVYMRSYKKPITIKVTGSGIDTISGFDDERMNVTINVDDIEFVIGC